MSYQEALHTSWRTDLDAVAQLLAQQVQGLCLLQSLDRCVKQETSIELQLHLMRTERHIPVDTSASPCR